MQYSLPTGVGVGITTNLSLTVLLVIFPLPNGYFQPPPTSGAFICTMTTETRTLVRIGQQYQLSYTKEFDEVRIVLDYHPYVSPGAGPLVLTSEQF
jgi:hypothetical protein